VRYTAANNIRPFDASLPLY